MATTGGGGRHRPGAQAAEPARWQWQCAVGTGEGSGEGFNLGDLDDLGGPAVEVGEAGEVGGLRELGSLAAQPAAQEVTSAVVPQQQRSRAPLIGPEWI
jgi:hypothetical protein